MQAMSSTGTAAADDSVAESDADDVIIVGNILPGFRSQFFYNHIRGFLDKAPFYVIRTSPVDLAYAGIRLLFIVLFGGS